MTLPMVAVSYTQPAGGRAASHYLSVRYHAVTQARSDTREGDFRQRQSQ
jgi:hypothetical protein